MTEQDGAPVRRLAGKAAWLRPDVKIEPLVGRWHAWQHLVSPAQLALNLAYRFIPLLDSFLARPAVHEAASRDPSLFGGPFVDLPASQAAAVKALTEDLRSRGADLLALAAALREVDGMLRGAQSGHSLDACYAALPAPLEGLVEMAYDLGHAPVFRLREALLYRAQRSGVALQEIMLHRTPDCDRKFFLNTPRLDAPGEAVFLRLPFDDARIDALARARLHPIDVAALAEDLGVTAGDRQVFDALFTDEPPHRKSPDYEGSDVRIRYFGHASVLLQTSEVSILIDPLFAHQRDDERATLTFDDLPDRIDYVVFSHNHQDHFAVETLLQLRRRIGTVVVPRNAPGSLADPSAKLMLESIGIANVIALDELESLPVPDGQIVSLPFPGEHCDLDVRSRHCPFITLRGRKFLFLVDSDAVDPALYRRLAEITGDVDTLFTGMECHGAPLSWLYGPMLLQPISRGDDNSRRGSGSNCARAIGTLAAISAPQLFIYAMGMEPWNRHLLGLEYTSDSPQITESDALVAHCRGAGISAERLDGCREIIVPAKAAERLVAAE